MTLEELLDRFGVPYAPPGHDHYREGWTHIDCSLCHQPGHFRLGIPKGRAFGTCWVCGFQRLYEILSRMPNLSPEAVRQGWHALRKDFALAGQFSRQETRTAGTYKPPARVGPLLAAHKAYLTNRGFGPEEVSGLWGVGGIGMAGRLGWRLFIPVHDRAGKPVSWTTRAIRQAEGKEVGLRYVSAAAGEEAVPHKELLYGEELVPGHAVAVQEGPPDAWRVGPGAVATLGVSITRAQVVRLAKYPHRIVAFDNEPAAQRRAEELCRELSAFPGETVNVVWESGKDASRSSLKEVIQLREMLR